MVKVGDWVRVTGIPPSVEERKNLGPENRETWDVFRLACGRVFRVDGIGTEVASGDGELLQINPRPGLWDQRYRAEMHVIWIEPELVEPVELPRRRARPRRGRERRSRPLETPSGEARQ